MLEGAGGDFSGCKDSKDHGIDLDTIVDRRLVSLNNIHMEDFETVQTVPSPLEMMSAMGFDYSVSALIGGAIFGIIGIYLFRKGRREGHSPNIWVGVGLMVYPLFVTSTLYTWVVGALLCGVAYYYWP